jgi:hypothetical protein
MDIATLTPHMIQTTTTKTNDIPEVLNLFYRLTLLLLVREACTISKVILQRVPALFVAQRVGVILSFDLYKSTS